MIHLVAAYRDRVSPMSYQSRSSMRPAWSVFFLCVLSISCFGQPSLARPAQEARDTVAKNTEVEYQRLDLRHTGWGCLRGKQRVVGDENALQALIDTCKDFDLKLPEIDFSKHTLIAMGAATDLCQKLELKIIRDDAEKRYRHIIIADRPFRCRGVGYVPFWVLVPKLPPGYRVTFEREIEPGREGK
jgi:hypothetical protein